MMFLSQLKLIGAGFCFFAALDMLWIGFVARQHYVDRIGSLLRYADGLYQPIWWAGILVWLLIAVGSYLFVLPLTYDKDLYQAAMYGALFGLVLYGVYDLTNYSLIKVWPLSTTLLDMAWGTFTNALLASFMWWLRQWV